MSKLSSTKPLRKRTKPTTAPTVWEIYLANDDNTYDRHVEFRSAPTAAEALAAHWRSKGWRVKVHPNTSITIRNEAGVEHDADEHVRVRCYREGAPQPDATW